MSVRITDPNTLRQIADIQDQLSDGGFGDWTLNTKDLCLERKQGWLVFHLALPISTDHTRMSAEFCCQIYMERRSGSIGIGEDVALFDAIQRAVANARAHLRELLDILTTEVP